MKTIWKFPLIVTDEQIVEIPKDAQALSVQVQGNKAYLWALVDPKAEKENRVVQIFDTGKPVSDEGNFVGTFQLDEGLFVGHVFIK